MAVAAGSPDGASAGVSYPLATSRAPAIGEVSLLSLHVFIIKFVSVFNLSTLCL
jgi:hypothetical protein